MKPIMKGLSKGVSSMETLTTKELKRLRLLEKRLRLASPHSKEAVAIGKERALIYRQAHIRNNPANPAIDKAMRELSKRLGI